MIYRDVPLGDLREPDWSWHYEDETISHKLEGSLAKYGQLRAIVVRQVEDGLEIVEGRSVFRALQRTGQQTATVADLGPISRQDAILAALSLELRQEIDYVRLGREVATLVAAQGSTFSAIVPFTGVDIGYYVTLSADFDWSQFHEEDRQEGLFEEELADRAQAEAELSLIEDITTSPQGVPEHGQEVVPQAPSKPPRTGPGALAPLPSGPSALAFACGGTPALLATPAVTPVVPVGDPAHLFAVALRQRGHHLLTRDGKFFVSNASVLTEEDREHIKEFRDVLLQMATPWAEEKPTSLAAFLGTETTRPDVNWRPDEPPSLDGIDEIVLNFATNGLDWVGGHRPVGVTVSTLDGQMVRFLPFAFTHGGNLDEGVVKRWFYEQVRNKKITNSKVKFDVHHSREWGIDLEAQGCTFSDIQHTAALLDDHRKRFGLDVLAADYFPNEQFTARVDETRHHEHHASEVAAREKVTAQLVGRLRDVMYPQIDEQDLRRVHDLEDAVIPAVVEMEKNGSPIDMELLEQYGRECSAARDELLWDISKECGFTFEHTASGWKRLIESLHLSVPDSFSESVLNEVDHPLIRKGQRAAQYASLNSKIFKAYPEHIVDGILRYNINQLASDDGGTVSGRFSIGLVQQVPNHDNHFAAFGDELFPRRLFIPGIGEYLEGDAEQIEFRLLVHYSQNARLLQAYQDDPGMSFHKKMQELLQAYKPDILYAHTKNYNFAAQYGARSIKLAVMMGFITEREGTEIRQAKRWDDPRLKTIKEIEAAYKRAHPEAGALLDRAAHLAKPACDEYCKRSDALHRQYPHRGYVKTMLGRRSRFQTNYKTYIGLNRILQGTGASIMKKKLVELHAERKNTGFVMRITNHDAALGDATTQETLGKVSEILNRQSYPLKVPIIWKCGTGANWAACK